jgi:hypothetical protein
MSDIEARVKKIIAEQLGVPEADVSNERPSWPTSAPTRWTPWSW